MKGFKGVKRLVVKVGTSSLTYGTGLVNMRKIEELCEVLSDIKNSGTEVVLVSSGAIAVGFSKLSMEHYPREMSERQACAAVGQCELMYFYDKFFKEYNQKTAQILLTWEDLESEKRKKNVENTFKTLLSMSAIPIVNENDTVSTEEISFGDNDTLSARVAALINADGLVLLSDIDGLFDRNPNEDKNAKLIRFVESITPEIEKMAGGAGTSRGTGGMATKIEAAGIAASVGCATCIMNSADMRRIYDLLEGKEVGTVFAPKEVKA
ncbi:MAG: glutamate 5-kinase [Clostridia bacterium]|nr:glutamate 5-kinase [Clostridia bacterium]